ncbi:ABC transporter ATP-binding protein [Agrobacterium pusense]|uniref:ABC transporter ATP-binding protein n=1 Tax=Agrobacterium pusense TaxID=648995 RepID=UPI0028B08779|nr:ABC transporter ATP-binding protein [Agrobacterium pusense]
METNPVLSVRNLTTSFLVDGAWKSVVRDVSFHVAPGETVAIVGESGSGKSVTSLSLMRLLAPASSRIEGEVLLNGRDLLSLSEKEMRGVRGNDISMIFQEPMTSLNPIFTIGRQISEVLIRHKGLSKHEARAETVRLLEKVRIPNAAGRFDEYPHQFSGGMRQRVMIAMALASRPKLLIADEPTTALDVTIQGQILDLIKLLQEEEGMSVLFITHDMGVVAEIADRTIVMYRGDEVETGPTEEIFKRGKHPYTRALLSAVPKLGSMRDRHWPTRFPVLDMKTGLADESVSALDVSIKAQVCNLLLDLQQSLNLAFLFISHDMAVVERVSHRVAVMYLGEIVEIGPRAAVFDNPQHPYTKKLMAAVPVPDPSRRGIRRGISNDELKSPIRAMGYETPARNYKTVSPGHLVQVA